MKKVFFVVLLVLAAGLIFSSCASSRRNQFGCPATRNMIM